MKGLSLTIAMHFGTSETTGRNLVPIPPARIIASLIIFFFKINLFHELAYDMAKRDMAFLDTGRIL